MPHLITSTRQRSAAETLAAIQPVFPKYDIHGYADHTPEGLSIIRATEIFRENPRSGYMNLGKGFGLEASLASGYMEAIELSTIEHDPEVPLEMIRSVAKDDFIYCGGDRKVRLVESIDASQVNFSLIPGIDLLSGVECYGFDFDHYLSRDAFLSKACSTNGLASGNTIEEARLHAIYEIIERHVGMIAFKTPKKAKVIELKEIPSPLDEAIDEIRSLGMQCELFQLGRLFDVNVIQCSLAFFSDGGRPGISFGFGAHHSPTIAISRALSEAVQVYSVTKAIRDRSIPRDRLKGGLLVSARQLSSTYTSRQMRTLNARLLACSGTSLSLDFETGDALPSASESVDRLIEIMRDSDISALFSWTLSPDDCPFTVVKCVIPEFGTFVR